MILCIHIIACTPANLCTLVKVVGECMCVCACILHTHKATVKLNFSWKKNSKDTYPRFCLITLSWGKTFWWSLMTVISETLPVITEMKTLQIQLIVSFGNNLIQSRKCGEIRTRDWPWNKHSFRAKVSNALCCVWKLHCLMDLRPYLIRKQHIIEFPSKSWFLHKQPITAPNWNQQHMFTCSLLYSLYSWILN